MIEAVEFPAGDGITLRGEVVRGGPDFLVLVHGPGEDLDGWRPLRDRLAGQGLSMLAFDLRGHGGSDGGADPAAMMEDIAGAARLARWAGAARLFLGVSGDSTGAGLEAAELERFGGLFALAPTGAGLSRTPALPKLTVCCSGDARQVEAASMLTRARGWSVVVHVPTAESGLAVLRGSWASNVLDYVAAFLRDLRRSPGIRRARVS